MESWVEFGARACLASPFLASAIDKTFRPRAALSEIRNLVGQSAIHPPITPAYLAVLAFQWSGSLLLLHPASAPFGAILLFIFLIPVTLLAHSFWAFPAGDRAKKRDHFFANIAIAGGLILVAAGGLR